MHVKLSLAAAVLAVVMSGGHTPTALALEPGQNASLIHTMARLRTQLALEPTQQTLWINVSKATEKSKEAMRVNRMASVALIKVELNATPTPNMDRVAALQDDLSARNLVLLKDNQAQWLALYAVLNAEQKTIVGKTILDRLEQADKMREQFKKRVSG